MSFDRLNIIYRGTATKHLLEPELFVDKLKIVLGSAASNQKKHWHCLLQLYCSGISQLK